MVCEGGSIILYDNSWSGAATAWNWTVTGPANFNYSTQNPTVTPLTIPGSYTVTLIASNSAGSDTITRPDYFVVGPNGPAITQPYIEGFESPWFMNLGYMVNNRMNNANYFQQTSLAAHNGTYALLLNNFGTTQQGDVDEFITPGYYLDYNTGIQLQFKYAYATANLSANNNIPKLRVYSSINCGQTWLLRWARVDSLLLTAGLDTNFFVPSPAMWDTVTINLPASCAYPNVRFKFEFSAPVDRAGNNLYIDDINILSTNVGIQKDEQTAAFNVYPNPGDGKSVISYALDKRTRVKVDLYDLSGRLVSSKDLGEQTAGTYVLPLSEVASSLAEGTYVIQMYFGDFARSQKLFFSGKITD
jgi:PKD repeat protein